MAAKKQEPTTDVMARTASGEAILIRIESSVPAPRSLLRQVIRLFGVCLIVVSLTLNAAMIWYYWLDPADQSGAPQETLLSGDRATGTRIVLIDVAGTISPPFTRRWIRQIAAASEDDTVKGVILCVDSPGGLVADSHQIYRAITELRQKKPVYVSMKRIAASGGYYIAMGCGTDGKIFAEPTAWTGSIGVIMPRYNISELGDNLGVHAEPLKTGRFKDSMSPFRDLTPEEQDMWAEILDESFQRFVDVIATNRRALDREAVLKLATGRIYTATQAMDASLIDEIGYEEDAISDMKRTIGVPDIAVVRYSPNTNLWLDLISMQKQSSADPLSKILDGSVPCAMYHCSAIPTTIAVP